MNKTVGRLQREAVVKEQRTSTCWSELHGYSRGELHSKTPPPNEVRTLGTVRLAVKYFSLRRRIYPREIELCPRA